VENLVQWHFNKLSGSEWANPIEDDPTWDSPFDDSVKRELEQLGITMASSHSRYSYRSASMGSRREAFQAG
jgi:hypothetical protein